jgi:excisionase family DNA binding protein
MSRLLTITKAAEQFDCHPETLRRAIRAGKLACYRFGGAVRLSPEHLQAWMDAALCPARDPQDQSLSHAEEAGQSSGGMETHVAALQQARRQNKALGRL